MSDISNILKTVENVRLNCEILLHNVEHKEELTDNEEPVCPYCGNWDGVEDPTAKEIKCYNCKKVYAVEVKYLYSSKKLFICNNCGKAGIDVQPRKAHKGTYLCEECYNS